MNHTKPFIKQGACNVWILLLNWKNATDTLECLDSILECKDPEIAGVIVCDNGSLDGSVEKILDWQKATKVRVKHLEFKKNKFKLIHETINENLPVYLIENGANLGFAAGNNIGLNYISTHESFDYVYLLNNDTLIESNTVSEMVKKFVKNTRIGLCGSKVIYEHTRNKIQAYGGASFNRWLGRAVNLGSMTDVSHRENVSEVQQSLDYILGASMMISKECLQKIGYMEEKYFLYYEEVDWAVRTKRAGFILGYAPESIVYHKEGASIGSNFDKTKRSLLSTHYLTASKVRFTLKVYPFFLPTVVTFSLLQALRCIFKGDIVSAKVILNAIFLKPFKLR